MQQFEEEIGKKSVLRCPCNPSLAKAANEWTKQCYGDDALDFKIYEQWLKKNKYILVCLTGPSGEIQGYFDLLPLKRNFMKEFSDGKKTEKDIRCDDILDYRKARDYQELNLYLAGLAVKNPEGYYGKRNACILIWGIIKYIEFFYPQKHRQTKRTKQQTKTTKLFALAASREGKELLERFEFQLISQGAKRRDNHDLYVLNISTDLLAKFQKQVRIPYENLCNVSFTKPSFDLAYFIRASICDG